MINSLSVGVLYPLYLYLICHQNFALEHLRFFSSENQIFTSELDILTCDWVFKNELMCNWPIGISKIFLQAAQNHLGLQQSHQHIRNIVPVVFGLNLNDNRLSDLCQ